MKEVGGVLGTWCQALYVVGTLGHETGRVWRGGMGVQSGERYLHVLQGSAIADHDRTGKSDETGGSMLLWDFTESLLTDVEHLFRHLFVICISSQMKCLLKSFDHFVLSYFYLLILRLVCILCIQFFIRYSVHKYFLSVACLSYPKGAF